MKTWSEFYPFVLPDVPGCPDPTVDHALIHASRTFFERTRAWDVYQDPVLTTAAVPAYGFDLSLSEELVKLISSTIDGRPLDVLSVNDLPVDWQTSSGSMRGILTMDRRTFFVLPVPAAAMSIRNRVALKPSNTSTGIPDELFAQYADHIAIGAKARLFMQPKKDYSDMALGQSVAGVFDSQCADVARKVEKSFSRTPRRTVANFF